MCDDPADPERVDSVLIMDHTMLPHRDPQMTQEQGVIPAARYAGPVVQYTQHVVHPVRIAIRVPFHYSF